MNYLCVYCGSNAGNDPRYAEAAVALGKRILTQVETQLAAAVLLVLAVARETVLREDRADVPVEGGSGRGTRRQKKPAKSQQARGNG